MERMKRALCLLLCFVMVVGLVPLTAFAAESAEPVSGTGNLVGGTTYTLDTNGVTANKNYLIVNTSNDGTGYALTNNNGSAGRTEVAISNSTITVEDDANIAWTFSGSSSGTVGNNGRYVVPGNGSLSLNTSGTNLTISDQDNGAYRLYYSQRSGSSTYYYYLTYSGYSSNANWTGARTRQQNSVGSVYLYELTSSSAGEAVVFTVTPGSATIAPEGTVKLNGTVTVAGETVNLSDCTITWASSDNTKATVSGGTVTGVADGTANITATLSAVNGTALQENIVLTVPVTVQSKTLDESFEPVLTAPMVTTNLGVEPDFSGVKLTVKYEGEDNTTEITTANGLIINCPEITGTGVYQATVSFGGKDYGTVMVVVNGNAYDKDNAAPTPYPVYPADGAVRIDKYATEIDFETTGVVQVELDVAGVSVKSAVDVILVTDLSNSMAWAAGGRTDATSHETTKMYDLQQSVASFADIFLAADEEGNATKNTMSLVTFGGYDADYTDKVYTDYADPTQTLLLGSTDADAVKTAINNIRVLGEKVVGTDCDSNYYLSFDGGSTYGENYGNTNYDHAFMQTADAIAALKAAYKTANGTEYDASGRQIYILFMTDGAPSNYDGVYYNYKTGDRADVYSTWVNEDGEEENYVMGNNREQYQAGPWFEYIAGGTYNATTDTIPGNPLYWADQVYNTTSVANIYSVGFDIDNGGFSSMTFTKADGRPLAKVLEKLVTGKTLEVYSADDQAGLSKIYADLATKIRYAGTSAQVTDIVDGEFDLQMAAQSGTGTLKENLADHGIKPSITIRTHDLWTKQETDDNTLIGTRKGAYTDVEVVTFNEDGTEAYSNLIDGGETNIMTTSGNAVVINAVTFTYTKTADSEETFSWNIGNITDKEISLIYYAYLTDTLEGERDKGLYYTNEEAVLEYIDINGKYANQIFPIPAVAWGGASTAYEFYLVNEEGKPCDRSGAEIPFANRIIITGPFYEELYLNQEDEEYAKEIIAAYVLPAGYTLYQENAYYTVVTASGEHVGSLNVSEPYMPIAEDETYTGTRYNKVENEDGIVSYVEDENGTYKKLAQTTIVVSATTPSYIQSRVAFGVMYNDIPDEAEFELTPDRVVIDYGKSIVINIANGNDDLEDGYTAQLVGFSKYYDTVDMKTKFSNTPAVDNFPGSYGIFSIVNDGSDSENPESTVRYTPTDIVDGIEMVFCVIKMHNDTNNDTYYMVDWLTVIPATSVYYETDFADGVFDYAQADGSDADDTAAAWETKTDTANAKDDPQDDGDIGVWQTYGYDSSYDDDAQYSNSTSEFVKGEGAAYTYTTFSFKGTGFDLLSRTGAEQGLISVNVYKDAAMTDANQVKSVSVLNKSDSNLELYQIPVVSINGLDYGTYYVKIGVNAGYNREGFEALYRGNEFYFDAVRIFDPAKGDSVAEQAYYEDGESEKQLDEVRQRLITAEKFNALASDESAEGVVFVDRDNSTAGEDFVVDDHNVYNVADYEAVGPNNEVYLSNGQAVAFKVKTNSIPASFDLGAKFIEGGEAADLSVTVTNNNGTSWTVSKTIASSTAQNINLFDSDLTSGTVDTSIFSGDVYVIITNTGNGVLSITDLKVAYGGPVAAVMMLSAVEDDSYAVSYSVDAATFAVARSVLTAAPEEEIPEETEPETTVPEETESETTEPEVTEPETTEPAEEPDYDIIRASANTKGGLFSRKTYFTVVTSQDVASLTIKQAYWSVRYSSMTYVDQADGTRVWTIAMPSIAIGTYTITGYGTDGTSGASATVRSWGL